MGDAMSLWSLFLDNPGRLAHKWKHYFPIYERHFARFVDRPIVMIEIGCGEGGSLQMWKRYLGPLATIVGLDIRPECAAFEEDQIHVRIGDQRDPTFLAEVLREFGDPSIVLDDGSHMMSHVRASFDALYPRVMADGVYMVEDLHTAYWDEYEGGVGKPESFIEFAKRLIDEINAVHSRGAVQETAFSKTTLSMHVYDSIIAFEKGSYGRKDHLKTGGVAPDPA
jgi:hypothetical protein